MNGHKGYWKNPDKIAMDPRDFPNRTFAMEYNQGHMRLLQRERDRIIQNDSNPNRPCVASTFTSPSAQMLPSSHSYGDHLNGKDTESVDSSSSGTLCGDLPKEVDPFYQLHKKLRAVVEDFRRYFRHSDKSHCSRTRRHRASESSDEAVIKQDLQRPTHPLVELQVSNHQVDAGQSTDLLSSAMHFESSLYRGRSQKRVTIREPEFDTMDDDDKPKKMNGRYDYVRSKVDCHLDKKGMLQEYERTKSYEDPPSDDDKTDSDCSGNAQRPHLKSSYAVEMPSGEVQEIGNSFADHNSVLGLIEQCLERQRSESETQNGERRGPMPPLTRPERYPLNVTPRPSRTRVISEEQQDDRQGQKTGPNEEGPVYRIPSIPHTCSKPPYKSILKTKSATVVTNRGNSADGLKDLDENDKQPYRPARHDCSRKGATKKVNSLPTRVASMETKRNDPYGHVKHRIDCYWDRDELAQSTARQFVKAQNAAGMCNRSTQTDDDEDVIMYPSYAWKNQKVFIPHRKQKKVASDGSWKTLRRSEDTPRDSHQQIQPQGQVWTHAAQRPSSRKRCPPTLDHERIIYKNHRYAYKVATEADRPLIYDMD